MGSLGMAFGDGLWGWLRSPERQSSTRILLKASLLLLFANVYHDFYTISTTIATTWRMTSSPLSYLWLASATVYSTYTVFAWHSASSLLGVAASSAQLFRMCACFYACISR